MPPELFTAAEWPDLTKDVVTRMGAHVARYTTPISQVFDHNNGDHWGSGSYCTLRGMRCLLTNEHVAAKLETHSLAYKFHGADSYFRFRHPFGAFAVPSDTALALIDDADWNRFPHSAEPIAESQFASQHAPVTGELLFLIGYAGARSKSFFGTLFTPGTPFLSRECALPDDPRCLAEFHFALDYNPAGATPVDERGPPLPLPPGLSGSLVWNTRVVEQRMLGQPWSPADARVTGIVWGWPSGTCLLATKVEHTMLDELVASVTQSFPG